MIAIWSVASITFKEGIKNRVLFGIFIIALLLFAATTVVTTLFMRDIVKVAVDLSLSTVSFAGLLTLLFVGVNLFAKDLDKRIHLYGHIKAHIRLGISYREIFRHCDAGACGCGFSWNPICIAGHYQ